MEQEMMSEVMLVKDRLYGYKILTSKIIGKSSRDFDFWSQYVIKTIFTN
jgi:hypothetical protein